MPFSEKHPSSNWEPLYLAGDSSLTVWCWYRPPAAPHGAFLQVPEETRRALDAAGRALTLRELLHAADISPTEIANWSLYGAAYEGGSNFEQYCDQPLPAPGEAADPSIGLFCQAINAPPIPPATAVSVSGGAYADAFLRMESEWYAALQLEIQVSSAAQQLKTTVGRLGSLSRDLNFDEARYADQRDKHDWMDARRWLRDVADRASRFLKDQQTGSASVAGKRATLEYLYENYISRRQPFEGMDQAERELESHRKALQNLLNNLTSANSSAVSDGERRAQQVLSRIAAKIRSNRSKR